MVFLNKHEIYLYLLMKILIHTYSFEDGYLLPNLTKNAYVGSAFGQCRCLSVELLYRECNLLFYLVFLLDTEVYMEREKCVLLLEGEWKVKLKCYVIVPSNW